jgi:signal transduction histidine kinase/DNA-binding response OmpR family regulator
MIAVPENAQTPSPNGHPDAPTPPLPTGRTAAAKCRAVALGASLVATGISLLTLLAWLLRFLDWAGEEVLVLASLHPAYVPMAPATCWAFLLLAGALILYVRTSAGWLARTCAGAAAALASLWGAGKLLAFFRGRSLGLEAALVGDQGTMGTSAVPVGYMSPLTAASFLLSGVTLLLLVGLAGRARLVKAGLTAALALANLWVLLGYLELGQLKFYEYIQIPVAITTATGFLALAVGLIAAEGPDHPLVRPLTGSSTRALLLRAFLPVTVAAVLAAGVLRSTVFSPDRLGVDLAVLFSTAWTLISAAILSGVIVQIARVLGGKMDRIEAARRQALVELREAKDAAEASNCAKSQFLANMSHELRTPLNAVIGYSELLQEEAEDQGQEDFLPDLQKINAAGKHLLALINDILDLSKIEAGKIELCPETFDLAGMVKDVATTIRPVVEKKGNKLVVQCADGVGSVHTDLIRLRQCLFNLLSNAGKFTEEGTISLIVLREAREGRDWLTFHVRDTGIGMTPEQMAKLFQAFTQADASTTRKYGGTGLGLAISLKLSELLGGTITVASEPGQGSTFTLQIPADVKKPEPAPAAPAVTVAAGKPGPRNTVLVVDDDPVAQEMLTRFLAAQGFHVVAVGKGDEVLRVAREVRPQAITLDVMMPGMDGWSVLSALKADPALADIPVVMVTIVEDRNLGLTLGASDYLTKPLDSNRLVHILKKHCSQMSPRLVALVAEDDPAVREMLRRMLEKDAWSVVEASNGREALECVAAHRPALIVLDLMMPEMDGFQFLAELRQNPDWHAIPVVVVTAKDLTPEDRLFLHGSALQNGCVKRIMQKGSFSREDLLREVRELVTRPPGAAQPAGASSERPHPLQPC